MLEEDSNHQPDTPPKRTLRGKRAKYVESDSEEELLQKKKNGH